MAKDTDPANLSRSKAHDLRYARELEGHLAWLDGITGTKLGVLAVASGIYTYLGVSSLLDDNGALSFIAAMAYSVAVSVAIFVFWSYQLRLPCCPNCGRTYRVILVDVSGITCDYRDVVMAQCGSFSGRCSC